MKIRNGFVSNSSSSSFVLLGAKVKEKPSKEKLIEIAKRAKPGRDDDWYEMIADDWYEFQYEILEELGIENPSEYDLYGKMIAVGGDYMDECEISLDKLHKEAELIKGKLEALFDKEVVIKLYTGEYPC